MAINLEIFCNSSMKDGKFLPSSSGQNAFEGSSGLKWALKCSTIFSEVDH